MFFRSKITKTGHAIQLVESYRDSEGKPRQRIIISLGAIDFPKALWKPVAEEIEARLHNVLLLFPPSKEVSEWTEKIVSEIEKKGWIPKNKDEKKAITVHPENITHHETTELGPELVALKAWEELGFPKLLREIGLNGKQQIDAALSIMNRILDPCSEHALPGWVRTTSFEDLFEKPLRNISEDRFYRVADLLLKHKERIEDALSKNENELFGLKKSILLYDLTNTYFEGQSLNNTKAKRGRSKEKRFDAPLLSVGLVLDEEGFVSRHEVFPGNMHDSQTLFSMIDKLQEQQKGESPLIILDSGLASEENLAGLRERGFHYIVVGKRQTRIAYEKEFLEKSFKEVSGREGKSSVRISTIDEENERIVLCTSEDRGKKEEQILSRAEKRYLEALNKLKVRVDNGRLKKIEAIHKAIGRLLERHSRVSRYYEVYLDDSKHLVWKRDDEKYDSASRLLGGYYLRSSRKNLDDETIWKLYITLTRVESGFRAIKSELGLRPVFHQKEDRCDSHIFITILAYRLFHWIEYRLRAQGIYTSWTGIKRILQTHCYTTIICPSIEGNVYHIRAPGNPDTEQSNIYNRLGIDHSKLPRKQTIL
jgi:transposase